MQIAQSSAPDALIMNKRTYIRRSITERDSAVKARARPVIIGPSVGAPSGALYVHDMLIKLTLRPSCVESEQEERYVADQHTDEVVD